MVVPNANIDVCPRTFARYMPDLPAFQGFFLLRLRGWPTRFLSNREMGRPYGWRHGKSIAAAPRKSNAMLPRTSVCLSKRKARRDALPDCFIVALMQECIKADVHIVEQGVCPAA